MAIYHCTINNIGRSSGKSAVACAAYRAGEKIQDEETGITHDYTRKSGIVYSEIILPQKENKEWQDRSVLWNEVEKKETKADSRLARQWECAIPNELSKKEAIELCKEYAKHLVKEGMCVDFSIHWNKKNASIGRTEDNHHVHFMGTTRSIKENGEWDTKTKTVFANTWREYEKDGEMKKAPAYDPNLPSYDRNDKDNTSKYRIPKLDENGEQRYRERAGKGKEMLWERVNVPTNDWNETYKIKEWREVWAKHVNNALEKKEQSLNINSNEEIKLDRVDHRSLEEQGINHIPTIHEGYQARQIELNGGISERMEYNRQVEKINEQIDKKEETIEKKGKEYNEFGRGESISGTTETNNRDNGRTNGANQGTATDDRKAESGNSELQGDSSSARDRVERLGDELQQAGERIEATGRRTEEQDIVGERTETTGSGIREASQGEREPAEVYRQRVNGIRTEQQDINGKQRQSIKEQPNIDAKADGNTTEASRVGREQQGNKAKQQSINREANDNIQGQRSFTQSFNEHLERVRGGFTAVRDKLKGTFENVLKANLQRAVERLRHLKSQAPEQEKPKQTTQEQPKQTQTAQSPLERMQQAQRMNAAEPTERSENNMSRGTNSLLQQAKASNEANKEAYTVKDKETPKNEAMDKFKELKAKTEANREEELEETKHIRRGRHR